MVGQRDPERATLAFGTLHRDLAAMLGDNVPADRQPKPGAGRLSRKEWLEKPVTDVRWNAHARVLNLDHGDAPAGQRADGQRAALRHRIDGVQDEVQEDLAKLIAVAAHLG